MRRRHLRPVLAAFAVALAGSAARSDDTPACVCPPAPGPIAIDGDLTDWPGIPALEIGETQVVRKDPAYGGPKDLSGRILVCRNATTLYVAGEVRDDTIFWNPEISWRGDGVELFLDFHPDPASRTSDGYDQYSHQLLLHPLAPEVRWMFARFRGREGRMDDPVDGIDLAGLRWQDEHGATVGYRFELALPLSNFPAAPGREGQSFGFDVALSDSDGLPEQKNYATWSGRSALSAFPSRFGRMVLGPDPPAPPRETGLPTVQILPVAFLSTLLSLVLFVWLARGLDARTSRLAVGLSRLAATSLRWKVAAGLVVVALIGAAGIATTALGDVLEDREVARKRETAGLVAQIHAEAHAAGILRPQLPQHPSPLVSLLAGQAVKPPTDYEFTVLPPLALGDDGKAVPERPFTTLSGVPFLRRDIPATAAWWGSFVVHPPVAAEAASIVSSWRPEPGNDVPPPPGAVVAEIKFAHQDGSVGGPFELVWGRHVDACDDAAAATGTVHPSAPESSIAFLEAPPAAALAGGGDAAVRTLHADLWRAPLTNTTSPVVRVEVAQKCAGGRFVTHGVTLHPEGGADPVPLPLGRATRSGLPTAASPFPSADAGIFLSRDTPRAEIACDVRADRLWLVVSLRRGFPDSRFGLPVLAVRPEFDDGSSDSPFRLENGLDVDAETTPARQHGPDFRSEIAFEWGPPDDRRHLDVASLVFAKPGRKLVRLHLEFKGEDEIVRVSSVVVGAQTATPRSARPELIESSDEGYRLPRGVLEGLAGTEFTAFRDGTAAATSATGPSRERALARTITPEQAAEISRAPAGLHEQRILDGAGVHALQVPLPGMVLEMTWTSTVRETLAGAVFWVRLVLGILLAPLAVLAVADLIGRARTLHARLVAVCAGTAAVPVVLGFFAVPELVGGQIEGTQRSSAGEKLAAVKGRLAALRSEARQLAFRALRDEGLQEALKRRGTEDFRASMTSAIRDLERNLAGGAGRAVRVAVDLSPRSTVGERFVFPQDFQWTVFRDRQSVLSDEFAWRWSRMMARGRAVQYDNDGNWQTTLVVEIPVDESVLRAAATAAGGEAHVLLYTPRGYPLASTGPRPPSEDAPDEMARKTDLVERIARSGARYVEPRTLEGTLHTVAYDVLRDEANVVALVATAVPRSGAEALLARIGAVSLLVFGAGVAMQFLLVGVVAVGTTRPWTRLVERARPHDAEASEEDDVAVVAATVDDLRAERDLFRGEMSRLATALGDLSRAQDPESVVERALAAVRASAAPWGAVLLAPDAEGRLRVAGGFRGGERLARGPFATDPSSPLAAVLRGRGELHVPAVGAIFDALSRDERRLVEGAASLAAYPLAHEEGRGGALLLLGRPLHAGTAAAASPSVPEAAAPAADAGPHAPSPASPPSRCHDEFLAALARQVGLALETVRLLGMAVRDPETGAHVASWFAERLREEVDRAVSAKRPIALLLVGVRAPPGDSSEARSAVQHLADAVRALAPGRAFLGRLEHLTLALCVPEADRRAADSLALELRRSLAEPRFADLRVRVGVAACPEDAGSSEFLLAEARRGLAEPAAAAPETPSVVPDERSRLVADARRLGAVFEGEEGRALLETVERIASSDITILLEGETGAGKEVIADLVHRKSARRDRPFVKVNCAALPDALLESELFGYERGAFTGADRSKPGRFELADKGTLFLDEIGEIPLATQAKLLRVLEDRTVEHLGGTRGIAVDVRVIVATNRDLRKAVAEGRFREDLLYRLNAVTIAVPPLRARKEDIPPLAEAFLRSAAEAHGRRPPTLQPDAMDLLFRHDWPGNVRELRNLMEQAVVLVPGDTIRASDLSPALASHARPRPVPESARPAGARDADGPNSPAAVSDRQRRLLALLAERDWITTSEYCEVVGISARTALRDVRELVERGVIEMEGKRRGARYRLPR